MSNPYESSEHITLSVEDGVERVLLSILYNRVGQQLNALRTSFTLDLEIRDIDAPYTWDEMDKLFVEWLLKQCRLSTASVSQESKRRYDEIALQDAMDTVTCERCGGDGWDPEGYLSMTGERMYCPRCGGNGVHRA